MRIFPQKQNLDFLQHCMKSWLWPSLIRIKSVVKVGPLSLTHESKVLGHFWQSALTQLWLASKLSCLWLESKVGKGTFDARASHIWQNLWSLLIRVKGVSHLTQIKNGLWLASKVIKGMVKYGLWHLCHMAKAWCKGNFSGSATFWEGRGVLCLMLGWLIRFNLLRLAIFWRPVLENLVRYIINYLYPDLFTVYKQ